MPVSTQLVLDDYEPIGNGLLMPRQVRIDVTDEPEPGVALVLEVVLDGKLRRYGVETLTIHRASEGSEIAGTLLRELRVQDYLRRGLQTIAVKLNDDGSASPFRVSAEDAKEARANGPIQTTLKSVASIYRLAEVLNQRPAKAVADTLEIPYPTATNWIARSRAAGWLS